MGDKADVTIAASAVALSVQDLRVVARYAAESAQEALALFEARHPGDRRRRAAVAAAWTFADGAPRTQVQRTGALAHLHPLAKATQVKHILGAAAHAARAAELAAGGDHRVGAARIEQARQRATPALVAVLRRYPAAPASGNRVAALMSALDTALRSL